MEPSLILIFAVFDRKGYVHDASGDYLSNSNLRRVLYLVSNDNKFLDTIKNCKRGGLPNNSLLKIG